jgi:hypothetical protein
MNEAEVFSVPLLSGGISQQPPNVRFPNQVQDATNIDFTVLYGACKRPCTKYVHKITGLTASGDIRLHAIERDADERYLVVYGDGALRAFTELGVQPPTLLEATVTHSGDATTYLTNGAVGEHIRLITTADYTVVINTTVNTALTTSTDYVVTSTWDTYEIMTSTAPANSTYHRTIDDSAGDQAGYYQFSSGSQTFGSYQFPAIGSSWKNVTNNWNDTGKNPMGFRVGFQRLAMSLSSCTTALVSGTTYTLTKASAFSSYTFVSGDMIYIASGTGVTAGWATIVSKDSSNQLTITSRGTCVLAAASNVATTGIGIEYDVEANFDSEAGLTPEDLYEVASRLQQGLRRAGCETGLIAWNPADTGGYFTITSPYKGTDSVIRSMATPASTITSLVQATYPFVFTGTSTTGTGGNPTVTQALDDRWTRVAAPNQSEAKLSAATMPVQMVRTNPAVYPAVNITSISATNPGVVTVSAGHDIVSNQKVIITGTSGTNASSVNAEHTATKITATTFSIPINLTGGAPTGGSYTARALFNVDTINWVSRLSGDAVTNEAPQPFQDGLAVRDACFVQDRLCLALGNYLVFSQAGDVFNFFSETWKTPVDSDPIVAPLSGQQLVAIDFITPYRDSILVFTFAGEHYEITWDQQLSPTSLRSNPGVRVQCWSTRPIIVDGRIYFNSERGSYAKVSEYFYNDLYVSNIAEDVTIHCPTFVPVGIKEMVGVPAEGVVICLPDGASYDHQLYVYRAHWNGNQKDQSAWTVYTFDSIYRITGIGAIRNAVYMLVESNSQYLIEVMAYEVGSDTF